MYTYKYKITMKGGLYCCQRRIIRGSNRNGWSVYGYGKTPWEAFWQSFSWGAY